MSIEKFAGIPEKPQGPLVQILKELDEHLIGQDLEVTQTDPGIGACVEVLVA